MAENKPTTIRYYYDGQRAVLQAESRTDGLEERALVYGNYIDEVLVMRRKTAAGGWVDFFYGHDHLYSPVVLFNFLGGVMERNEYDAYGAVNVMDAYYTGRSDSVIRNSVTFNGRELDVLDSGSLNIMYYRARYYDPQTGRFMQRDPMEYFDGMNIYEYVLSAPLIGRDPFGLSSLTDKSSCDTMCQDKFWNDDGKNEYGKEYRVYNYCLGCCMRRGSGVNAKISCYAETSCFAASINILNRDGKVPSIDSIEDIYEIWGYLGRAEQQEIEQFVAQKNKKCPQNCIKMCTKIEAIVNRAISRIHASIVAYIGATNQNLQRSYEVAHKSWEGITASDRKKRDRCMEAYKEVYAKYEDKFGRKPDYTQWGPCKTYWQRLAEQPEPQEPQYYDIPKAPDRVNFNCHALCNKLFSN